MRWMRTLPLVTLGPLLLALVGLVHPGGLAPETAHRWVTLHIVLLPVFPLLALGFPVLLRPPPAWSPAGPVEAATVIAWVGAAVYAVAYTGLDAVAGIGAGTIADQPGDQAELRALVLSLYDVGDRIGQVGVYAFLVAVLAGAVALGARHGARVLPGTVILLGAGYSFIDSHIFWPRGVATMLAMAAGFALWAWATAKRPAPAAAYGASGAL
ncbi:hypothetical protein [Mangrovihabitans endophyticus]|uniref:Uncharacterized protein n=1 Tax=Mangrovihabitans endophyticus TaxID=1751298 RepID=A0A8J3C2R7_9ACTN|nr:hypothetical protein [Mangrovihabitans endophyticus]GGK99949.1 hypothetical protein GCM10012284_37950 [Mangrovihabitans endophyticus]